MGVTNWKRELHNETYGGAIKLLKFCWTGVVLQIIACAMFVFFLLFIYNDHQSIEQNIMGSFVLVMAIFVLALLGEVPIAFLGFKRCFLIIGRIMPAFSELLFSPPGFIIFIVFFVFFLSAACALGPIFLVIDTVKWARMEPLDYMGG